MRRCFFLYAAFLGKIFILLYLSGGLLKNSQYPRNDKSLCAENRMAAIENSKSLTLIKNRYFTFWVRCSKTAYIQGLLEIFQCFFQLPPILIHESYIVKPGCFSPYILEFFIYIQGLLVIFQCLFQLPPVLIHESDIVKIDCFSPYILEFFIYRKRFRKMLKGIIELS